MKKTLFTLLYIMLVAVIPLSAANKKFTLVIDAGHGGRDAGAVGSFSKEKDLTLKMALAFGRMVEDKCPDVKVVYTRKTDVFLELSRRAEIANRHKADLFISIHINAVPKGKYVRGYQTWTLGRGEKTGARGIMQNLDVAKRENSVIFLEKNYKQTYQGFDPNSPESSIMFEFIQDNNMEKSVELAKLLQKNVCASTGLQDQGAHQNNLAVLRLTSMPGCLCELGFISTPAEEEYMNSAAAPQQYAQGIFQAFMKYRAKYDKNVAIPYEPTVKPELAIPPVVPQREEPVQPEQPKEQPVQAPVVESVPQPLMQPVPQQEVNNEAQPAENPAPTDAHGLPNATAVASDVPVFKVQILALDSELKPNSPQFKGVTNVSSYREGGMVKYTVGESTDYKEIVAVKKSLADKFPQAFLVAFKNGKRISVNEALKK